MLRLSRLQDHMMFKEAIQCERLLLLATAFLLHRFESSILGRKRLRSQLPRP
jgi:hypothetical protein